MGKVTQDDLVNVDDLIQQSKDSGNYVDVNSLIADGTIQKKNPSGNGLNQPSPSQSQSPLQSGSVKTFDEPALKLSDGGVPVDNTQTQTAPTQNIDFNKLNAQHGIVAPTTEEKTVSAASEEKVQEKVGKRNEAIANTLSKKYGNNQNSPEYRKEFNDLKKKLNDGDVVLTHAQDGKPFVVRSQGFLESAGKSLIESFKAPIEGFKIQNMDGKELADYLDKKSAEQPYLEESAPSPFLGELGSAGGGFPKIAGEFGVNAAVPFLGTAIATADAELSAAGNKTAELYQKNLKQLTDNGVPLEKARIEAADKAKKDAPIAAAPDAILTAALGEYGADTKGISDAAQTFKQTLIKSGESIGKFGVLGGTAGVSEAGIEKAQGYDISMKDALDKFGEEGFQYATMDAMFKILPVASKLPSAAYRAWKEYMTKIPAPQFLDEIDNQVKNGTISQDEADKAAANLGGYVKAKNKTIPTGNIEKDGLITELVQKKLKLEEDKKTLDPSFHEDVDKQIADIDSKINLVKYSKRPIEVDDITGEFNLNPKSHDELSGKEKEGIVVPKEYGGTEVEEVGGKGEDAETKYKPTAYVTEKKGSLEIKQPIEVGDKTYSDKQKAQAAADKALKQHYYENGLHESGKPQKKQQDNGLQLQKEEEAKVTEPTAAGAGGETAPAETEAAVSEKPLSRDEIKSLHDNLTPEQKQEYLDAEVEGKGDEYLKSLNNGKTLPNATTEEKPKEESPEVIQQQGVEGNQPSNEPKPSEESGVAETKPIEPTQEPTTEEIKQLNDVHRNLAVQYLKKHTELLKQGLRGDELNNHPELVAIKSQMDKIEQAFKNDFKSKPTETKPIEAPKKQEHVGENIQGDNKVVNYEDATKISHSISLDNLPKGIDEKSREARSQIVRDRENTPPTFEKHPIGTYAVDKYGEAYQLQELPIKDIITKSEGTQREETVSKYAKWQKETGEILPVKGVENYAEHKGKVVITDGQHRVLAAKQNGNETIPVWVALTDPKNHARPLYEKDIPAHNKPTETKPIEAPKKQEDVGENIQGDNKVEDEYFHNEAMRQATSGKEKEQYDAKVSELYNKVKDNEGLDERHQKYLRDKVYIDPTKSADENLHDYANKSKVEPEQKPEKQKDNSVVGSVKPIRQLGNGANVYYETKRYRVNDKSNGKFLLNIEGEDGGMAIANIEFDNAKEAVQVAEKLNQIYPKGVPDAVLIDKVVEGIRKDLVSGENKVNLISDESKKQNISTEENKGNENSSRPLDEKAVKQKLSELDEAEIVDPYDKVLHYFANDGKIHNSAIEKLFGGKDKRLRQNTSTENERRSRIGLIKKDAPTIEGLAHKLWEGDQTGKYDTQDYKNAIEQVLLGYNSKHAMAKDLVEKYDVDAAYQKFIDQNYPKELIDKADKVTDEMSDEELNHLLQLSSDESHQKELEDYIDNLPQSAEKKPINTETDTKIRNADISNASLHDDKNVGEYVAKAKSVLETLYPKAKLEVYDTEKEYLKNGGEPNTRGLGILDKNGEHRILLNLDQIKKDNSGKTAFHEVLHPIVYDAFGVSKDKLVPLWNSIADAMENVKGFEKVSEHISFYDKEQIPQEGLTELLTQIATGNIDLTDVPKSKANKIIDLVNKLFETLGIHLKLNSVEDFHSIANKIKDAFESGDAKDLKDVIKGNNIDKYITDLEKRLKDRDLSQEQYKEKIEKLKSLGYTDEDIKAAFKRKGIAEEKVNEILSQTKTENDALQEQGTGSVLQHPQEAVGETGGERGRVESGKQGEEAARTHTEEKQQKEVGGEPPTPKTKAEGEEGGSSIIHERTAETRKEFGLGEYQKTPETFAKWDAEAEQRIKEGEMPDVIKKLKKGLQPDEVEQRMMGKYVANLEANASADPSNENLSKLKEAIELSDRIGGSEVGKSLVARKGTHLNDESLASYMLNEMDAAKVDELTPEQKAKVEKEWKDIQTTKKEFDEYVQKKEAELAEREAKVQVNKTKATTNKNTKKTHDDYVKEREQIFTDIKDKLRKARGQASATIVPYANELIAIAPDVAKLVKNLLDDGITKLEDIVKNIHGKLKEDIPNLQEKDVHDIIAGNYNKKKLTRNETVARIRDLQTEAGLINKYQALERGEEPKIEKKKVERNKTLTELRKQIKEHDLTQLATYKSRTEAEVEKLKEQLKKGDFARQENKQKLQLDKQGLDLKDKLIKLRQEREIRLLKEKYSNRDTGQKITDAILEVANVPRAIMSSMDFSAPLRQGLIPTISHPLMAARAAMEMFKQAGSQKAFDRWFFDIKESPRYELAKESKLYLADPHDPILSAKEEQFMTNLAEKIPYIGKASKIPFTDKKIGGLIKGSERAYLGYLNKMRWDLWNRAIDAFEKDGKTFDNSQKLYEAMADYINASTGRGSLGRFDESAKILNAMFFSPRLIASRLKLLTNPINPYFYARVPKAVKVQYFKDMATFIGVGLGVLALAKLNGATVEDDPRSSDFGKVKVGDTRYDIWGGFQQYIRLVAQLFTGQRKTTTTGQIQELKADDKAQLMFNFARGKLSPVPATAIDVISGEDIVGNEITPANKAESILVPMIANDVADAMKDSGVRAIFTVGVPAAFGVGVQTYNRLSGKTDLKSLVEKNMDSHRIDADTIKKVDDKGGEHDISKAEFNKYVALRDSKIKTELEKIYQDGVPVVKDGAVVIKPFKEITANELADEIRRIKSEATRESKDELFPVPENIKHQRSREQKIMEHYRKTHKEEQ